MRSSDLTGRKFGSLQVICFWGNQSSNRAWAYFCRACGHVGKRLGTTLTTGRNISCPRCPGVRVGRSYLFREPDPALLIELMSGSVPANVRILPRLEDCTMAQLHRLATRLEGEFTRRLNTEETP